MRNISPPIFNAQNTYVSFIKGKRKTTQALLKGMQAAVLTSYAAYNANSLATLIPLTLTAEQEEALLTCYRSNAKPQKSLWNDTIDRAGALCPYCGSREIAEVDHFAPQSLFPEFSTFPLNLIGICGHCNKIKDNQLSSGGSRIFFHAYLDQIPADSYCLTADTIWNNNVLSFNFELNENCPNIPQPLMNILKSHIKKLNILKDFAIKAQEDFYKKGEWENLIETPERVREKIQNYITVRRQKEGPFSWEAAYWLAVLNDNQAIDYLCEPR